METQHIHQNATRLRAVLLVVLVTAVGWAAYSFYDLARGVWEFLGPGNQLAGSQASVEAWSALGEIDHEIWLDLLGWLLLIPALGKCFAVLWRMPWGKDFTWSDGQWIDTDVMAVRAGAGLPLAQPLRESPVGLKLGLLVMAAISAFMLLAAAGSIDLPEDGARIDPWALVPLIGAVLFACVVGYACATTFTRRIQFDDAGLCDANFFRSQRVPWSVVKEFIDDHAGAGATSDSTGNSIGTSPVWRLKDARGRSILELARSLVPAQALVALRQRFASRMTADSRSSAGEFGFLDAAPFSAAVKPGQGLEQDDTAPQVRMRQAMLEHAARFERLDRGFNRGMMVSMSLLLALFLAPAVITSYQALWFVFAAAQTEGVVVEIPEDSLPSLVVEYRVGKAEPLRTSTDGSALYSGYKVGDKVRVFYDPAQPEDARLDFFLELWLGPMVLGGLALIVGLVTALIARSFKPRRSA